MRRAFRQMLVTCSYGGCMARIRSIAQGQQTIRPHRSEVDCFYNVVQADDGALLLHLSTFGSDDRTSEPKSSQSIQVDEDNARQLVEILITTFPSIKNST
ncbi:hypothetical protein ABIA65_004111 [Mycolicibacterium sp. 624]|jgi:hypothetical protein